MFKWFGKKNKVSKEQKIYNKIQEDKIAYSSVISYLEFVDPGDEGRIFPIRCKNGKIGRFKVVELTPCAKWGSRNVKLLFTGYSDEKPVKELSYEEFIEGGYMELFENAKFKEGK